MVKQILNTLYVQTEGMYLSLDHETLLAKLDNEIKLKIPLHHLGGIVAIGRVILSSPLLAKCAAEGRNVSFLDRNGHFQYRIEGPVSGNILLRKAQFELVKDQGFCEQLVKAFLIGKIHNSRLMLQRVYRELKDEGKKKEIKKVTDQMKSDLLQLTKNRHTVESMRGMEGINAKRYFSCFPIWIKSNDECFVFRGRNRRPPRDPVNATLSMLYRLLLDDCVAAIQGVGLDPQLGFLHVLRPGRPALGLDLMEELRPIMADRLAMALINKKRLKANDFKTLPTGAVYLNDKGREKVIKYYQEKKQEEVTHSATGKKVKFGLLPHLQAKILARAIRQDHLQYEPYLHR